MTPNVIIMSNMVKLNQQLDRAPGYYWVKFPHTDRHPGWEPGSWDDKIKMWLLIGSGDPWYDFQMIEVGEFIGPYTISPKFQENN